MHVTKDFSRGLLIAVVFAIILLGLIPVYVVRPSFIPGFAPPPDMWPRVVSGFGLAMGILAMVLALLESRRQEPMPFSLGVWFETHCRHLMRFAAACAVFAGFVLLIPLVGFLAASIFLAMGCFVLTGDRRHTGWMVVLAVGLPAALYVFFATVMNTPFPKSVLGRLLDLG